MIPNYPLFCYSTVLRVPILQDTYTVRPYTSYVLNLLPATYVLVLPTAYLPIDGSSIPTAYYCLLLMMPTAACLLLTAYIILLPIPPTAYRLRVQYCLRVLPTATAYSTALYILHILVHQYCLLYLLLPFLYYLLPTTYYPLRGCPLARFLAPFCFRT